MVFRKATLWYLCVLDFVFHLGVYLLNFPLYCHCFVIFCFLFGLGNFGFTLSSILENMG
ncbi:hypothetical protein J3F84DRAFT_354331 [Trichoderma pleuroticola]